jgi:hypothetical protein
MFIINIELSPVRNKLYRLYLIDGNSIDIGNKCLNYYICHQNKEKLFHTLSLLSDKEKQIISSLKPSQLLYETFILNGYSVDLIKNINFFNQEILPLKNCINNLKY